MISKIRTPILYITSAILGVLLVLLAPAVKSQYEKNEQINKNIDDLRQQIYDYNKKNSELQDKIAFLSELSGKEKIARDHNLKREGEIVVSFMEDDKRQASEKRTQPDVVPTAPHWQNWLNYFFGS